MRQEHTEANRLIDIALTRDREAYRAELERLYIEHSPAMYDRIVGLANMQYRMETRDYRYTAWRAEWKQKRGEQ